MQFLYFHLGWAQINFTFIFGRDHQKKTKKVFNLAVYLLSGHLHCLAGRGGIKMVLISLFAHKVRGEDQKKRSSARNLWLSFGIRPCFSSWNVILLTLGAQAVFWGAQAPKCTPVAQSSLERARLRNAPPGLACTWVFLKRILFYFYPKYFFGQYFALDFK